MDVTVIGCGYVGLVTGTCLASVGHTVRGVEKDAKKLKTLQDGHCPIFEPGLQELMQENYASGQLQFTKDVRDAVKDAEIVFLCVGTPSKPDGTVDMTYLEQAGKEVCDAWAAQNSDYMVTIIVKSTVPPGTNRKLYNFLREQTKAYVQVVSSPAFLKAGCGYGGSCFPKDVAAMEHISKQVGHESLFVHAVQTVNKNQKKRFVDKLEAKLGRPIAGATIAVWGLAFKADTDDIRESAAIDVIRYLLDKGAHVKAHDYKGMDHMKQIFKDAVEWCSDPVTAAAGADAVALVTDWPQYTTLPFRKISATMNTPIIFDGRNCLHRDVMRESGFQYYPMGRPPVENKLRLKTRA